MPTIKQAAPELVEGPDYGLYRENMHHEHSSRIIDFSSFLLQARQTPQALSNDNRAGAALLLEPRTIRHQERVEDLFYLLFKRTGS